jgi:BirA family biotin operon repressor/biotin-[acetyl-CoA-carboxylase] ligase
MSLLLRPPLLLREAARLTMCLGLGAAEGVEAVTGLRPVLKWPNDLLLDGRKLGGMLAELQPEGERIAYAVLGLGLNANLALRDAAVPPELAGTVGSLSDALGRAVDLGELLAAILWRCEAWYDGSLAAHTGSMGGTALHDAWAARLDTLGRMIVVSTPQGSLRGRAVGVSPEGALHVEDAGGHVHTVWSGDIAAVRLHEDLPSDELPAGV